MTRFTVMASGQPVAVRQYPPNTFSFCQIWLVVEEGKKRWFVIPPFGQETRFPDWGEVEAEPYLS